MGAGRRQQQALGGRRGLGKRVGEGAAALVAVGEVRELQIGINGKRRPRKDGGDTQWGDAPKPKDTSIRSGRM